MEEKGDTVKEMVMQKEIKENINHIIQEKKKSVSTPLHPAGTHIITAALFHHLVIPETPQCESRLLPTRIELLLRLPCDKLIQQSQHPFHHDV
jgi:hypothetical protein